MSPAKKATTPVDTPIEELSEQEIDERIAKLELSRINIKVTPGLFDRLYKQAEFHGLTIEEHCANILAESCNTTIGAPTITGPSNLSGVSTSNVNKVVGPSLTPLVTRA